jgi:hypothetical protein
MNFLPVMQLLFLTVGAALIGHHFGSIELGVATWLIGWSIIPAIRK